MAKYKIVKLDFANLGKSNNMDLAGDSEKYAFFYSKEFEKLNNGEQMNETSNSDRLSGYLKITSPYGKVIYRKYRSLSGIKQEEVHLTYRSYCELASVPNDVVLVERSSWFPYYWRNSDAGVKWPFRIAFIGIILSIISFILTLYQMLPLCNCHHSCC